MAAQRRVNDAACGQVHRVGRCLVLEAVAGEMATAASLTVWLKDAASAAVRTGFETRACRASFGTVLAEEAQMLSQAWRWSLKSAGPFSMVGTAGAMTSKIPQKFCSRRPFRFASDPSGSGHQRRRSGTPHRGKAQSPVSTHENLRVLSGPLQLRGDEPRNWPRCARAGEVSKPFVGCCP